MDELPSDQQRHDAPADVRPAEKGDFHRETKIAYDRTWELELLISGAVVFALLQLPGALDRWFWRVDPHVVGAAEDTVFLFYFYSKLIVYTLITTFIVHLAARAYWVGLLGIDTVFPGGVRWEKLTQGPITRRVYQERQPSLEGLIRRVDRFCSVIFSFAFMIVFMFAFSIVLFVVAGAVSLAISSVFLDGEHLGTLVQVVSGAILLPLLLLPLVDRWLGPRLDPERGAGRLLYRFSSFAYGAGAGVTYIPVFNILVTNARKNAVNVVFGVAFFTLMLFFYVKDAFIPREMITVSGYQYLPDVPGAGSLDYRYYVDLRGDARLEDRPSVQSQVIRDPFVRLFIPYTPGLHDAEVTKACGTVPLLGGTGLRWLGLDPAPADSGQSREVLECLGRIQAVALDGRIISLPRRFYTEPETGRRGVVVFVPTAGLAPGEHVLRVRALPDPDRPGPRRPFEIPFWVAPPAS